MVHQNIRDKRVLDYRLSLLVLCFLTISQYILHKNQKIHFLFLTCIHTSDLIFLCKHVIMLLYFTYITYMQMQGGYFMKKGFNTLFNRSTQEARKYRKKSNSQLLVLSSVNLLARILLLLLLWAVIAGFCYLTSSGIFYEHELLYCFGMIVFLILYFLSSCALARESELIDAEIKMRNMF